MLFSQCNKKHEYLSKVKYLTVIILAVLEIERKTAKIRKYKLECGVGRR